MADFIVVVDDDKTNLKAADRILGFYGYKVKCLSSGEGLLSFLEEETPDLILLDLHMEGIDGFETMQNLRGVKKNRDIPIIFLTSDNDPDTETKALSAGAMDFVAKPIVASVLIMRVRHTLELIRLQRDLKSEVQSKTAEVLKEHERNERLSLQIVRTLAGTIDAKDSYTNGHSNRVAEYARRIAAVAGYSERAQDEIYMIGLLHDVGKIGVPDTIINKPSRLTDDEYEVIKTHSMKGFEILRNITEMPKLAVGARWHHERFDGTGYPDGLKGEDIPEEARIIAVADAYDAMSSRRSYHDVLSQQYILDELRNGRGSQFDPRFADIMISIVEQDHDYELREHFEDAENSQETEELSSQDNERRFSFLDILEVGGLKTALGMKYCINDVDFYAEMLTEFTAGAQEREEQLEKAYEDADWKKLRVYAHSLKSASRTIGAEALSDLARQIEDAAKNEETGFIVLHFKELIQMLKDDVSGIMMGLAVYKGE